MSTLVGKTHAARQDAVSGKVCKKCHEHVAIAQWVQDPLQQPVNRLNESEPCNTNCNMAAFLRPWRRRGVKALTFPEKSTELWKSGVVRLLRSAKQVSAAEQSDVRALPMRVLPASADIP